MKWALYFPMNIDIIQRICETGPVYASLHELFTAVIGDGDTAYSILEFYPFEAV